jgi:NhaP-type Na+/H+ or K+/H+ antiporter
MIGQKASLTGSMLGSMIIFNDPTYIIIAGIGAFVSAASAYHNHEKDKVRKIIIGLISGFSISLLSFMLLIHAGDSLLKNYLNVNTEMLPSFWFVLTIIIATEATTIMSGIKRKIRKLSGGENDNE